MLEIINDSVLNANEKYIAHICNATANQAGGLTHYIFEKFPYSNIYKNRPQHYRPSGPDFPGQCVIKGDGINSRYIINMIAQFEPAYPNNSQSLIDGLFVREGYFSRCLRAIAKLPKIESIAFPHNTGCYLTGGNWDNYLRMIKVFAMQVHYSQGANVRLYKP